MNYPVTIAFLGDISLNDDYRVLYEKGLNPFEAVESVFNDCDLVVGNLECLLQGTNGENLLKKPRLHTDENTINYAKKFNLGLACLANNHVYDNLEDGFQKTLDYLSDNKIAHIGASFKEDFNAPYVYNKGDIKIGILNYVTDDTNPKLPENAAFNLNLFDKKRAINDIKTIKSEVDHVAVFIHWGGKMEGSMFPDIEQPELARLLIDNGADIIIGHHSHTVQPYEIYQGKYIFYSLGNFCFSDISFEGRRYELDRKRTNPSVIVKIKFLKSGFDLEIIRTTKKNCFIYANNDFKPDIIKMSYQKNILYKAPFWSIYLFFEKKIYPIISYFFLNQRNPIKQLRKIRWASIKKHFIRFLKPVN